jgi:hypothetical protein
LISAARSLETAVAHDDDDDIPLDFDDDKDDPYRDLVADVVNDENK